MMGRGMGIWWVWEMGIWWVGAWVYGGCMVGRGMSIWGMGI